MLAVGLIVASVTDARSGRIPNALTFPMVALGIAIHAAGAPPWAGLLGAAVAFAIHFPLFALGVERGGDAKLLMGVGACVGWSELCETSIWLAVLYFPLGLLILALRGKLGNLVAAARYTAAKAQGVDPGEKPEPTTFRTGPVIAVAATLAWATDVFALWR
ncbi:MAG: A24 family peptidase [Myxococcota bacterium]